MNTDHLLQHKKDLETLTQLLSNNNNSTTTNNNNNNNNSIISNSLITQQSFNYVSSELILDDGEDDDDDDDFSGEGCCDFDDHYDEELLDTNPTIPPSIVSNIQENQKLKTSTTTTTTNSNSNNNTNPISRKLNSILESSIATNPPNTKKVKYSYNDFIEATDLNKDNLDPEKLELLKINEEYQNIIQKYIKQIEYAKARNAYLLKKAKACFGKDVKTDKEKNNEKNSTSEETYKKDLKAGIPYFSYQVDVDGVTQTFFPQDNPDNVQLRNQSNNMPLYFKVRRWTPKEITSLTDGVRTRKKQKLYFQISQNSDSKEEYDRLMREVHNKTDLELEEVPLTHEDFGALSLDTLQFRNPSEVQLRWLNYERPGINKTPFTKEEDKKLLLLSKKYQEHNWEDIALELNTNRTPLICIQRYQRSLNGQFLKKEWTKEEDEILMQAFKIHGDRNWQQVAEYLVGRTGQQCLHRWQKTVNPGIKKGRWTKEEDDLLIKAVEKYGKGNWIMIKKHVPHRTDMQCRERYCNVLDPAINKSPWSAEEDARLFELCATLGMGKWSEIAKTLGGRTDNQCWRRWKQVNKQSPELKNYREKVEKRKRGLASCFSGREKERSSLTVDDVIEIENNIKLLENLDTTNLTYQQDDDDNDNEGDFNEDDE